mgnify:CR=1 FL=1
MEAVPRESIGNLSAIPHQKWIQVDDHVSSQCSPNSWSDYLLDVTEALSDANLLFEVEMTGRLRSQVSKSDGFHGYA